MQSQTGVESTVHDRVLTVRFSRPETLNALTAQAMLTAAEAFASASADPAVRVVLLTGSGRAFSSGASLAEDTMSDTAVETLDAANVLVAAIVATSKPVVAAVNGLVAGVGATIALACDLVVMKQSGYLLLAFANIGLMPDGGATAIVPAAIGRARAARMALLAERVPAQTAFDWGLVSHVVADEEFDASVGQITARLADGPTQAYAQTKRALNAATLALLEQAHRLEYDGQLALFDTEDFAEGVAAFRERRPAVFRGR
jgi:enoyl-CoA hydratase/carnithine racemase